MISEIDHQNVQAQNEFCSTLFSNPTIVRKKQNRYKLTPVAKLLTWCNTVACKAFKEQAPVSEALRFEALSRDDSVTIYDPNVDPSEI